MTATVHPGLGAQLEYGGLTSGSATYTVIAQVVSLDGPSLEMGTAETTNLASTVKTYRPTLPDGGELSGTIQYDPTAHATLSALMLTNAAQAQPSTSEPGGCYWRLTFNDLATFPGTQVTFTGILTKFQPKGMEAESNLEADFTIKLNSVPTL